MGPGRGAVRSRWLRVITWSPGSQWERVALRFGPILAFVSTRESYSWNFSVAKFTRITISGLMYSFYPSILRLCAFAISILFVLSVVLPESNLCYYVAYVFCIIKILILILILYSFSSNEL